ncbi:hypothetical protein EBU71_00365 [bacterium]|nr:hypothetical protein [Candidatus Elulimicrobium humile]
MSRNHIPSGNDYGNGRFKSVLILVVIFSWALIIGLVYTSFSLHKEKKIVKNVLREQFEKVVYTSKILNNFEPASHPQVIDTLFNEWIKHRRKE